MLSSTAQKGNNVWPLLSSNKTLSSSFFGDDKKTVHVAGKKNMLASPLKENNESDTDNDECKAPAYNNSLSDALAKALSLNENMPASSGKKNKKKAKKTLLFSSGMNFN
jgi:uncharacterized Zn-finger protein